MVKHFLYSQRQKRSISKRFEGQEDSFFYQEEEQENQHEQYQQSKEEDCEFLQRLVKEGLMEPRKHRLDFTV